MEGLDNEPLVSIEEAIVPIKKLVPHVDVMLKKQEGRIKLKYGLSRDEYLAIRLYTMESESKDKSLYTILNETFRDKDRNKLLEPWYKFLALFLAGLLKVPKTTEPTIFRAMDLNVMKDYVTGHEVTWWGFSSCTTRVDVLEEKFLPKSGARTLFIIKTINGRDIALLSEIPDEKEVLLLPGSKFRVLSKLNVAHDFVQIQLEEMSCPNISHLLSKSFTRAEIKISYKQKGVTDQDLVKILDESIRQRKCSHLDLSKNQITEVGALVISEELEKNKVRLCDCVSFRNQALYGF